jgi:hypothetical protein
MLPALREVTLRRIGRLSAQVLTRRGKHFYYDDLVGDRCRGPGVRQPAQTPLPVTTGVARQAVPFRACRYQNRPWPQ